MPDIGTIVSVVFPLLTILAVGACALLYSVQTTLRANNGDLKERVSILESEQRLDRATIDAQSKQIESQANELAALGKVITGEVQLVAITDLLTEHHSQAVKEWNIINENMAALLALFKERPPS